MKNIRINISSILFGLCLGCGIIPILIASLIMRHNLIIEVIDRMDEYWKQELKIK